MPVASPVTGSRNGTALPGPHLGPDLQEVGPLRMPSQSTVTLYMLEGTSRQQVAAIRPGSRDGMGHSGTRSAWVSIILCMLFSSTTGHCTRVECLQLREESLLLASLNGTGRPGVRLALLQVRM